MLFDVKNSIASSLEMSAYSGRQFYFWVVVLPKGDENGRLAMVDYLVVLWMTINLENVFTCCLYQTQPGLI
jgi:hypothetical protein